MELPTTETISHKLGAELFTMHPIASNVVVPQGCLFTSRCLVWCFPCWNLPGTAKHSFQSYLQATCLKARAGQACLGLQWNPEHLGRRVTRELRPACCVLLNQPPLTRLGLCLRMNASIPRTVMAVFCAQGGGRSTGRSGRGGRVCSSGNFRVARIGCFQSAHAGAARHLLLGNVHPAAYLNARTCPENS